MEVQAPTEQNLFGEEAVRLGRDWPTEHDDTTHMKRGRYGWDNDSLGKVVDSDDGYSSSSSRSAKCAKMNFFASESDPSADVGSPRVEATKGDKDSEKSGESEDDDEDKDEEVTGDPFNFRVCRQTVGINEDGKEEECGGEKDWESQICHSCKLDMKRRWFA